jgi:hypothetical protein
MGRMMTISKGEQRIKNMAPRDIGGRCKTKDSSRSWTDGVGELRITPIGALILEDDVERMDDTRNVTQDGKQNVDP